MFKAFASIKKLLLVATIAAVGLLAFPAVAASAAAPDSDPPPGEPVGNSRLERAWERLQRAYEGQGNRLDRAGDLITRIQARLDQAEDKGWNTSAAQAALDSFEAALPAARAAHAPGAAVIARHAGFDPSGRVTDRAAALETVEALRQVIGEARRAMNGTGEALLRALQALRRAHPPAGAPVH